MIPQTQIKSKSRQSRFLVWNVAKIVTRDEKIQILGTAIGIDDSSATAAAV